MQTKVKAKAGSFLDALIEPKKGFTSTPGVALIRPDGIEVDLSANLEIADPTLVWTSGFAVPMSGKYTLQVTGFEGKAKIAFQTVLSGTPKGESFEIE